MIIVSAEHKVNFAHKGGPFLKYHRPLEPVLQRPVFCLRGAAALTRASSRLSPLRRDPDLKAGPPGPVFHGASAPVGLRRRPDDGQPQSGAATGPAAGFVPPVEGLKNMGQVLVWDKGSVIIDPQAGRLSPAPQGHLDASPLPAVPQGIGGQVLHRLPQARPVPPEPLGLRGVV